MMDSTTANDGGASAFFEASPVDPTPSAFAPSSLPGMPPMPAATPAAAAVPPPTAPPDEGVGRSFQDLDISSGRLPGSALGGGGGGHPATGARFDATVAPAPTAGGASPDLAVTVGNPAKVGEGMSAFFTYEVRTKTSLPQYAYAEFAVTRRFRDFDWLHTQLCSKFPGAIVPPLPEKHAAQVSTYKVTGQAQSAAWLEERRAQLQRFLQRLVAHPMLHSAADLQAFLEKTDDALEQWKERAKPKGATAAYSLADVKTVRETRLSEIAQDSASQRDRLSSAADGLGWPRMASDALSGALSDALQLLIASTIDLAQGLLSVGTKSMSLFGGEALPAAFTALTDVPCQQMANYTSAVQAQVCSIAIRHPTAIRPPSAALAGRLCL